MLWLAFKTLFHEKARFMITLIGITISTILTLIEIAIYLGMMANATAIIQHTDADIWVASKISNLLTLLYSSLNRESTKYAQYQRFYG